MATDINSILQKYLAAMGKSEASASELSKELRSWIVENGEVVKEKIEGRIDETASRMGFVKASDLDVLLNRISDLESRLPDSNAKSKKATDKSDKSSSERPVKKPLKKPAKKNVSSAKKSVASAKKKTVSERSKG